MSDQNQVIMAWKAMRQGLPFEGHEGLREEIALSWKRSLALFGPEADSRPIPPASEDTSALLKENEDLCRVALPVIREYADYFVRQKGLIFLVAPDGRTLYCQGDTRLLHERGIEPGTVFSEEIRGANAMGLCLRGRKPAEVVGAEHFFSSAWDTFSCAEPLWGGKFRFIGALGMIMPLEQYGPSSVMFLRSVASNINSQHHIHDLLNDQETMLGLMNDGVLILNKEGDIKAINSAAKNMLDIPCRDTVAVGPISDFVADADIFMQALRKKRRITDEEIALNVGGISRRFILSVSFIPEDKGILCTLAAVERMQKFAARAAGCRAIYRFDDILGASDSLQNAVQLAKVAAQSDITTLLLGESGTGKELFAHSIHNAGTRRDAPFVVVNCGALPRDLVQSELFGYEGGSFTGASKNGKPGKFELADGGTIFLDEIGEMPMEAQTNLLRLIQNREVCRIGGTSTKPLNVRIIAATNRNLTESVQRGTFRSDLYYRLCVLAINIPALRERGNDTQLLAEHYLGKYTAMLGKISMRFSPEALDMILRYRWPGNIRELENMMEYVASTASSSVIYGKDLPMNLRAEPTAPAGSAAPLPAQRQPQTAPATLQMQERQAIIDTIIRCGGNIRYAAEELGIARSALYSKMARYGIDQSQYRARPRKSAASG